MKKVHPLAYYLYRDLNHTFGNTAPTNQIFTKKLGVRCWIGGRSQPSDPLEEARKNGGQRVGVIRASVNACHYFRECGSFMDTASWWRSKPGKCGTEGRVSCPDLPNPRGSSADMNRDCISKTVMLTKPWSLSLNMLRVSFCFSFFPAGQSHSAWLYKPIITLSKLPYIITLSKLPWHEWGSHLWVRPTPDLLRDGGTSWEMDMLERFLGNNLKKKIRESPLLFVLDEEKSPSPLVKILIYSVSGRAVSH